MRDQSMKLEVGPLENRYWQEYAKQGADTLATTVESVSK